MMSVSHFNLRRFGFTVRTLLALIGPGLRDKRMTENWAYGRFNTKLGLINMDMSGGYDRISCLVSAYVHKFLSYLGPHL